MLVIKKQLYKGGTIPMGYCELVFKKLGDKDYEVVKDRGGLVGGIGARVGSIDEHLESDRRVCVISNNEASEQFVIEREQRHYNFSPSSLIPRSL